MDNTVQVYNTRRHHLQSIHLNDISRVAQSYGLEVTLLKLVIFSFGFMAWGGGGRAELGQKTKSKA